MTEAPPYRIVHLSDPHGRLDELPLVEGDLLAVSGDLCRIGGQGEVYEALDRLAAYPCARRILVPGNHDWWPYRNPERFAEACAERGIAFLADSGIELGCGLAYGMPWTERKAAWNWPERDSAWSSAEGDPAAAAAAARIPDRVRLLVTHAPPRGLGDAPAVGTYFHARGEVSAGSLSLRGRIERLPLLRLVLSGHVHGAAGMARYGGITCVNAAEALVRVELREDGSVGAETLRSLRA